MRFCIYCGNSDEVVGKSRLNKLDGTKVDLLWWCGKCTGKAAVDEDGYEYACRKEGTLVPSGCLFVARWEPL